MSNPFKALHRLIAHGDHNDEPHTSGAEEAASSNCHDDVYHLQVQKNQKINTREDLDLRDGKVKRLNPEAQPIDNTNILQLSREERQERFEHAVSVKLGQPWDHLAHQVSICREDYVDKNGNEDPSYYRRRRFKRQTEVTMNELPTDKFYFQAKCCARTAISKESLNQFATIAEYYGFGVKERPVSVFEDIELQVLAKDKENNVSPYYGGSTERGFSGSPNYCMLGFRLEDGSLYRFTQSENGQKLFRDKEGLWLCADSKAPMKPEDFLGRKHSWVLYKQQENPDAYMPQNTTKEFAIKIDTAKGSLTQTFADGTTKEITADGVTEIKPVKSGS